jgi:hypothetical protein
VVFHLKKVPNDFEQVIFNYFLLTLHTRLCHEHYRQGLTVKEMAMEPVVPSTLAEYCITQLEKYKSKTDSIPECECSNE